jgi:hypothetical protein
MKMKAKCMSKKTFFAVAAIDSLVLLIAITMIPLFYLFNITNQLILAITGALVYFLIPGTGLPNFDYERYKQRWAEYNKANK